MCRHLQSTMSGMILYPPPPMAQIKITRWQSGSVNVAPPWANWRNLGAFTPNGLTPGGSGRYWGQSWSISPRCWGRTRSKFGPILAVVAAFWSLLRQRWPNPDHRNRRSLADVAPIPSNSSSRTEYGPKSADIGSNHTAPCKSWRGAEMGWPQTRQKLARMSPTWGDSDRTRPELGRIRSTSRYIAQAWFRREHAQTCECPGRV